MRKFLTKRTGAVALALTVGLVAGTAATGIAGQGGLPADKTAVAGSGIRDIGPNTEHEILYTKMAVSSPADLILGVTLECSILTRLVTNNGQKDAITTGSVDLRITIDNKTVPVQTSPTRDDGSVTFCNRTYQRTVTDQENDTPPAAVDQQDDYIRTKTANAFNWVALNVGTPEYDDPTNGNNVIEVRVLARYTDTSPAAHNACVVDEGVNAGAKVGTTSCSEAFVGKRTLVIEPVHAANGEQSEPAGSSTSGGGSTGVLGL